MLFIVVASVKSNAQWKYNITTEQEYNDNPFRTSLTEKTIINSVGLSIGNDIDNFSFSYTGNYFNFTAYPDRNFYWHQLFANYSTESSNYGIQAEQRLGKDVYTYFNYSSIEAFYNYQTEIDDYYLTLAPNFSVTKYQNISILDNMKLSLSGSINHGFESGTTIILGEVLTLKKYLTPSQSGVYAYLDENNILRQEFYVDQNISSLFQSISAIRIAQSIFSSTGVAFQFTHRSILTGVPAFVKDLNMIYGDESELFDDPVNYKGNHLSFELTQIMFDDLTIKADYFMNYKNYPSQGIYDINQNYDTNIMRSDIQKVFNISLTKIFTIDSSKDYKLNLGLNFQSIRNESNSSFFNYKSNSVNLSLGFEL